MTEQESRIYHKETPEVREHLSTRISFWAHGEEALDVLDLFWSRHPNMRKLRGWVADTLGSDMPEARTMELYTGEETIGRKVEQLLGRAEDIAVNCGMLASAAVTEIAECVGSQAQDAYARARETDVVQAIIDRRQGQAELHSNRY